MNGPFVIACRGHSGGRMLCEGFIRNGVQMGNTSKTMDTKFFAPARNRAIREIILHAFRYSDMSDHDRQRLKRLMQREVDRYVANEVADPARPFGWKFGETLFALPVLLDSVPTAKVIHLIRDGRDVMMSRLNSRFGRFLHEPFNRVLVFGDENVDEYKGLPLTPAVVTSYRNELEMLHWVTAVSYGLRGRAYGDRYLEVKYEDLCAAPLDGFRRIFEFLGLRLEPAAEKWLTSAIKANRIYKWRTLSENELAGPLEIGGELLRKLGYS